MIDEAGEDDLNKLQKKTEDASVIITGGKAPVFKVSAGKVMEAYEEGKSPEEINKIKKEWGMEELEKYLYRQLEKKSSAEEVIRFLCNSLNNYFENEKIIELGNPRGGIKGSAKMEIQTLIGSGIIFGGGAAGAAMLLGALTAITGAGAAAADVTVKTGLPALWAWLTGSGSAATSAASTGTIAAALLSNIVPLLGGVAISILAYKIGTSYANSQAEKAVPEMVEKAIEDTAAEFEKEAYRLFETIREQYKINLDAILERYKDDLDETMKAKRELNTEARMRELDGNLKELNALACSLTALCNRIGV